jgi:Holliday junction resolvase RusA-like endonuclease
VSFPSIAFVVESMPVAQPRQRLGRGFDGRPKAYLPADNPVHGFKLDVRQSAIAAMGNRGPWNGPIGITLEFYFARPQRLTWKKKSMPCLWHEQKPDLDNLEKAVLDALKGVIWQDDAQVAFKFSGKAFCAAGQRPRVYIKTRQMDDGECGLFMHDALQHSKESERALLQP